MAPILTIKVQWKSIRMLQRFIMAPQLFPLVPSRRQHTTVCQTLLLQEFEIHRDFGATDTCYNRPPLILWPSANGNLNRSITIPGILPTLPSRKHGKYALQQTTLLAHPQIVLWDILPHDVINHIVNNFFNSKKSQWVTIWNASLKGCPFWLDTEIQEKATEVTF